MNRNYIVNIKNIGNINKIINKLERRRERLINENQIKEEDFPPLQFNFSELDRKDIEQYDSENYIFNRSFEILKHNSKDYMIVNVKGVLPIINKWEILGEIKPLEDVENEYTLKSYNELDMPIQYRNLENPTECEHCNTNRKRKRTYVIKNKETSEVLQVGASCMTDFIDKTSLSSLINLSNLMDELDRSLNEKIVYDEELILFGKNEYLATQLSAQEVLEDLIGKGELFEEIIKSKLWNRIILSIYDDERKKELEEDLKSMNIKNKNIYSKVLSETFVTDDNRDKADDILDFYEELDVSLFKDSVFNMTQILNLKADFVSENESKTINESVYFYDLYQNKNYKLKNYFANYNYGLSIEQNLYSNKDFKKEEVIACLLKIYDKEEFIQYNAGTLENPSTVKKLEHILLPEIEKDYLSNLSSEQKENYNKTMDDFKSYNDKIEEAKEVLKWYKKQDVKKIKSQYIYNLINNINNDNEVFNTSELKNVVFSANYYKKEYEKEILLNEIKNNYNPELSDYSFTKGDKIENIDLLYKNCIKTSSSFYGDMYINKFEDQYGSIYTIIKNEPLDESIKLNQWVSVKANVSDRYNYRDNNNMEEKQTKLNRVQFVSNSVENNPNNPVNLAGKYSLMELQVVEKKVFNINNQNIYIYVFEDIGGNEFKLKTSQDLELKEAEIYKMGAKLSERENYLYNFSNDKINKIENFSKDFNKEEYTENQINKIFKIDNKKNNNKIKI